MGLFHKKKAKHSRSLEETSYCEDDASSYVGVNRPVQCNSGETMFATVEQPEPHRNVSLEESVGSDESDTSSKIFDESNSVVFPNYLDDEENNDFSASVNQFLSFVNDRIEARGEEKQSSSETLVQSKCTPSIDETKWTYFKEKKTQEYDAEEEQVEEEREDLVEEYEQEEEFGEPFKVFEDGWSLVDECLSCLDETKNKRKNGESRAQPPVKSNFTPNYNESNSGELPTAFEEEKKEELEEDFVVFKKGWSLVDEFLTSLDSRKKERNKQQTKSSRSRDVESEHGLPPNTPVETPEINEAGTRARKEAEIAHLHNELKHETTKSNQINDDIQAALHDLKQSLRDKRWLAQECLDVVKASHNWEEKIKSEMAELKTRNRKMQNIISQCRERVSSLKVKHPLICMLECANSSRRRGMPV